MTRPKAFTIMNFIMQRAIFFIVLMMVWYLCYPDTLRSMEETAFWTDAPDMTNIMYHWPADWAEITSHYLAQYFIIPFCGAAIMAMLPLVVLLSADVIVWQLTRCRRLQCLSFIPATVVVCLFLNDNMLTHYLQVAAASVAIALLVFCFTFKNKRLKISFNSRLLLFVTNITPYIIIIVMTIMVTTNNRQQRKEYNVHIEHMAEDRRWDELLSATYPERNKLDDSQMAYSLLALSQQGQLANRLFHYPVKGLDNIFAHSSNFRFNSFFCHELGLPNEAIRYAFEEGQYMPAGASFGTMRRMVDWILQKGDDPQLAEFYMNILSHSSCHDNFIATRRIFMNQAPTGKPEEEAEFVGSPSFLYEAALVLDREPDNTRARDYLLCGLLLMGNTEAFYDVFERIYVETNDEPIPTHYLEALLVLKKSHPQIDTQYNIPIKIEADYRNFLAMVSEGEMGKSQAQKRYANTYWAYLLRSNNSITDASPLEIKIGPEFGN